jgi:hypothetical protein
MGVPLRSRRSFLAGALRAGRGRAGRLLSPLRAFRIKRAQRRLAAVYPPDTERLVVFLTHGVDAVWGGILSTVSIYEETLRLKQLHGAEVMMCTLPGSPSLLRYTKFANPHYVFSLPDTLARLRHLKSLLIHVPECHVRQFLTKCSPGDWRRLTAIPDLRFNVMIANIELLDPVADLRRLSELGRMTCTTAHRAYSGPRLETTLGCPVHELSVYVSPEQYERRRYAEKDDLMIVSPDPHPRKADALRLIGERLPRLGVQVVSNLTYEQYKALIARAKWSLTFGEGLDGYFVETIFSGGIGFGVYNPAFFTEDFKDLRTVYPSYEVMVHRLCSDLQGLDDETAYSAYQSAQHTVCAKYYQYERYRQNVRSYYARYFAAAGEGTSAWAAGARG